jgi:hypothetical protein
VVEEVEKRKIHIAHGLNHGLGGFESDYIQKAQSNHHFFYDQLSPAGGGRGWILGIIQLYRNLDTISITLQIRHCRFKK